MEYYKEKYEQAIESLRSLIKNDPDHIIYEEDIIERIPELKESEDERIRGAIIDHLKDNNLIEWAVWLEKQGEQKPIEWSSDDEQFLLICKNALAKYQVSDKWDADIISRWLKNKVRPTVSQPKQEWSEEDEIMFLNLVGFLEGKLGTPQSGAKKFAEWLKYRYKHAFPMPHWKPNEKQMKALKEAVDEHFDIDGGELWYLYNDLKKL